MARKRKLPASRDAAARRWAFGVLLAIAGGAGGALLGAMVVGNGLHGKAGEAASFAGLSANPDAVGADSPSQPPCFDCADSYGVAARLRAEREHRMDAPFRELGAVDVDAPPLVEPESEYRYGGRFPDEPPIVMISPVAVSPPPEASPVTPAESAPPPVPIGEPVAQ